MIRAASFTTILLLFAIPAFAADNGVGVYMGASAGQAAVRDVDELSGLELDSGDTSYKAILGFRAAEFLAFELNYVDLGQPQQTFAGQRVQLEAQGVDAFVILSKRIAMLDLYAKVGVLLWEAEASVQGLGSVTDDGTDLGFGGGMQLHIGSVALRAEYEQFEISDIDDVNLVSVGLTWIFR